MWVVAAAALLVATVASAQPARSGCGPAGAGCGPAAVGVPGATLGPTPAPSWVSATLAAWMLDETSGTRVNAQGNASLDISLGANPASSTDHMEGTRAVSVVTAPNDSHTAGNVTLSAPVSLGCWLKDPGGTTLTAALNNSLAGGAGIVQLMRGGGQVGFTVWDASAVQQAISVAAPLAWQHAVGVMTGAGGTNRLYTNGIQATTGVMTTVASRTGPLYLGDNYLFLGLLDECFVTNTALAAAAVCRICSCGLRGEQCICNGPAFVSTGRNATACGSCTLPVDCSAAAPGLTATARAGPLPPGAAPPPGPPGATGAVEHHARKP